MIDLGTACMSSGIATDRATAPGCNNCVAMSIMRYHKTQVAISSYHHIVINETNGVYVIQWITSCHK